MKYSISPSRLKTLRNRKGWSRADLAKKSHVTERRILDLEKPDPEPKKVQRGTMKRLAEALRVNWNVLSGEKPLPPLSSNEELSLSLDPKTRLNYDLIKRRYGLEFDDIVNLAPLLFIKAAEESLERQRGQLEEEIKHYGDTRSLRYQIAGISKDPDGPWINDDLTPEDYFQLKYEALAKKDLFEKDLLDEDDPPWDQENPFADYLRELSETPILNQTTRFDGDDEILFFRYWYYSGNRIPSYIVCRDLLEQVALGSINARLALEHGVVSIGEIPPDLWEPRNAGDRVAFLEEAYLKATQKDETAEA